MKQKQPEHDSNSPPGSYGVPGSWFLCASSAGLSWSAPACLSALLLLGYLKLFISLCRDSDSSSLLFCPSVRLCPLNSSYSRRTRSGICFSSSVTPPLSSSSITAFFKYLTFLLEQHERQ